MGKKPFIDKKAAKHFHVVHRSQKDPLINDTEAPDRVLREVLNPNLLKHKSQAEIDRVYEKPEKLSQDEIDKRIGQAALYGIYYDDGEYDYTQHLKPMGNVDTVFLEAPGKKEKTNTLDSMFKDDEVHREQKNPNLFHLPTEVLPSSIEMKVGVMNQPTGLDNGLQPDMDPRLREVLEALSDEEYVENDLEEDFFEALNAEGEAYDPAEDEEYFDSEEEIEEYYEDEDEEEQDQEGDEVGEENYDWQAAFKKFKLNQNRGGSDDEFDDEAETKSKGTSFSVSSSAMHRNSQLRLLDDRFEKIEEEYADDDDESEYESGEEKEERADFDAILDEFLEKYEIVGRKMQPKMEGETSAAKLDSMRQGLLKTHIHEEEIHEPRQKLTQAALQPKLERPEMKKRETWDCQSIVSTYSNLENHPALINDKGPSKRIRIDPKTGMPILVEVERKKRASKKNRSEEQEEEEEEEEESDGEQAENKGAPRTKEETKEEKKARKQAVKEAKKNRREEKKTTKSAFKDEEIRQKRILQQVRQARGATHIP
ncbi:Low temperature viability protein-domain-containing protein [Thamnidium elegans]|nr:Low temperature viability protein-domain-containing protein [Thamnidium elegans]